MVRNMDGKLIEKVWNKTNNAEHNIPATIDNAPSKAPIGNAKTKDVNRIIVLKSNMRAEMQEVNYFDNLEKEYSEKFGCKVIILREGLELVCECNG